MRHAALLLLLALAALALCACWANPSGVFYSPIPWHQYWSPDGECEGSIWDVIRGCD